MMISRKEGWLSARAGAQMLMFHAERDIYIGLTEVGSRVWEMIEQPRSLDEICTLLQAEFAVDDATCRAEVTSFLDVLAAQDAATLDGPA